MPGAGKERTLVRTLGHDDLPDAQRRAAMRCPASGGATTRSLPDVLAARPLYGVGEANVPLMAVAWAIELKCSSRTTAYADAEEIADLREFAAAFGARPLVAAKPKRMGKRTPFYLVEPDNCRITDGGNYGVPFNDAQDRAYALVWAATDNKPPAIEVFPETSEADA